MIRGCTFAGTHTNRFDLGPGPVREVDFSGPQCDTIEWTHQIAATTKAGSLICTGNEAGQATLIFRDPAAPHGTTWHIDAVRTVGKLMKSFSLVRCAK